MTLHFTILYCMFFLPPIPFPENPVVTEAPANITIAIAMETVELTCSAEGFPTPSIMWLNRSSNALQSDGTFSINSSSTSNRFSVPTVTTSTLSFSAGDSRAGNNSQFTCEVGNVLGRFHDIVTTLRIAGPPNPPGSFSVSSITSSSATFSWTEPFSLVNITGYNLTFLQVASDSSSVFQSKPESLEPDQLQFTFSKFLPFSNYSASLTASSRAGESVFTKITFVTEESSEPN